MNSTLQFSITGSDPLSCQEKFEKWYKEQKFALSNQGGNHFVLIDRIWIYKEFSGGSVYNLTVLYRVEFSLNDTAM